MLPMLLASLVAVLPPVEFDHEPLVRPEYQVISSTAMQLICFRNNGPLIYSCSRPNRLGWCEVYLPNISDPNWPTLKGKRLDVDDVGMLKRHEDGHCNGAPADHRGWRIVP